MRYFKIRDGLFGAGVGVVLIAIFYLGDQLIEERLPFPIAWGHYRGLLVSPGLPSCW
jgi:hypothetical protein